MKTLKLATMAIVLILSGSANAALIERLDRLPYNDAEAALSWLADANDRAAAEFSAGSLNGADITVVPVPAAAWLFSVGLVGLFGIARRKPEVVSKKPKA